MRTLIISILLILSNYSNAQTRVNPIEKAGTVTVIQPDSSALSCNAQVGPFTEWGGNSYSMGTVVTTTDVRYRCTVINGHDTFDWGLGDDKHAITYSNKSDSKFMHAQNHHIFIVWRHLQGDHGHTETIFDSRNFQGSKVGASLSVNTGTGVLSWRISDGTSNVMALDSPSSAVNIDSTWNVAALEYDVDNDTMFMVINGVTASGTDTGAPHAASVSTYNHHFGTRASTVGSYGHIELVLFTGNNRQTTADSLTYQYNWGFYDLLGNALPTAPVAETDRKKQGWNSTRKKQGWSDR